jgi:cell division protein ZapA (FtsZ GTPase activity inhibitor)
MAAFSSEYMILGQKVVIRDPSEAELADVAMKIVNEKIEEIRLSRPMLGPSQIAVLALLEIAGSMVKDRRSIDRYREELDKRCTTLMGEIGKLDA